MPLQISVLSREYVKSRITPDAGTDLTGATVEFAFMTGGAQPQEADWLTGELVEDQGFTDARILVGPGGDSQFTFSPEEHQVWLAVNPVGSPERPVRRPGVVDPS